MSKEKHTKGPWHPFVSEETDTYAVFGPENDAKKVVIQWTGFDHNERPASEIKANVYMAAAAPELYEALMAERELVHDLLLDRAGRSQIEEADDKSDKALKKARGEDQ